MRGHSKLQKIFCKRLDKKYHKDLLENLDEGGRVRLRSCSGPFAAGWQLASPAHAAEKLDDIEYSLTARALLGQSVRPASALACQNIAGSGARVGVPCGEALCEAAHHAHRCARGGRVLRRTRAVEDVWEDIHKECGYATARQVHVPAWDRLKRLCRAAACERVGLAVRGAGAEVCAACGAATAEETEEAILDLEVSSASCPRLFFDVTVRHSVPGNAERHRTASRQDGVVAAEAETDKRARYPEGVAPWRALPLAHETYGRLGPCAVRHLKLLAREEAARAGADDEDGWGARNLAARWGARLSVALHRANVAAVLGASGVQRDARTQWLESDAFRA